MLALVNVDNHLPFVSERINRGLLQKCQWAGSPIIICLQSHQRDDARGASITMNYKNTKPVVAGLPS